MTGEINDHEEYDANKAFYAGLDPRTDEVELRNTYIPGKQINCTVQEWSEFLMGVMNGEFEFVIDPEENDGP